ncbi:radial spokehead-like protein, partial [Kipferlia bialata]
DDEDDARPDVGDEDDEMDPVLKGPPAVEINKPKKIPTEVHEGVNATAYWACQDLQGQYTMLPEVTPQQIRLSRFVHCKLSGSQEEMPWERMPKFGGSDLHLLRCRIARICHACKATPKGVWVMPEEEEEDAVPAENEEFVPLKYQQLLSLDQWEHTLPILCMNGRVTPMEEEEPEEEEEDEVPEEFEDDAERIAFERTQAAKQACKWQRPVSVYDGITDSWEGPQDSENPILKPAPLCTLEKDAPLSPCRAVGGWAMPAWVVRTARTLGAESPVIVASTRWPGAMNVAADGGLTRSFVYFGDSLPVSLSPFHCTAPPPLFPLPMVCEPVEQEEVTKEREAEVAALRKAREEAEDEEDY